MRAIGIIAAGLLVAGAANASEWREVSLKDAVGERHVSYARGADGNDAAEIIVKCDGVTVSAVAVLPGVADESLTWEIDSRDAVPSVAGATTTYVLGENFLGAAKAGRTLTVSHHGEKYVFNLSGSARAVDSVRLSCLINESGRKLSGTNWSIDEEFTDNRRTFVATRSRSFDYLAIGTKNEEQAGVFVHCFPESGDIVIGLLWPEKLENQTNIGMDWSVDGSFREDSEFWALDNTTKSIATLDSSTADKQEFRDLFNSLSSGRFLELRPLNPIGRSQGANFDLSGSRPALDKIRAACPLK